MFHKMGWGREVTCTGSCTGHLNPNKVQRVSILATGSRYLKNGSLQSSVCHQTGSQIMTGVNDNAIPTFAPNIPEIQRNCETIGHESFLCTMIND